MVTWWSPDGIFDWGGLCWLSAVLAVTVIIDSGGISTVDLVIDLNGSWRELWYVKHGLGWRKSQSTLCLMCDPHSSGRRSNWFLRMCGSRRGFIILSFLPHTFLLAVVLLLVPRLFAAPIWLMFHVLSNQFLNCECFEILCGIYSLPILIPGHFEGGSFFIFLFPVSFNSRH